MNCCKIALIALFIFFTFFRTVTTFAQKVGLVLSGGGAKGIAHISVIKALEENGIPIDYISGASMGAIVGGLYASGYSPDQMVDILKSPEFESWSTGEIPKKYYYYYKERYQNPSMFNLRLIKQDSITRYKIPVSIVSPHSMDLGLLELFAQSGAKAANNFDSLFVPFRCVASDVYKGEAVVFKSGELPSAIRASMTYPFYFQPIEIDGVLYFDGGIYNNFPYETLIEDFNPDIIIGIKVSSETQKPDEDNLLLQIENMVIRHTDYNLPPDKGILVEIDLKDVSVMEFDKYEDILKRSELVFAKYIDSIKSRIKRRVEYNELLEKRSAYIKTLPPLTFDQVIIKGLNSKQVEYVVNSVIPTQSILDIEQLRSRYFRLVTDDKISRIYPRAIFNSNTGYFNLLLDIKSTSFFETYLGGNISSSAINQGFAGFDYKYLNRQSYNFEGNIYFGRLYSSVLLRGRAEYPGWKPFFLDVSGTLSRLDFFSSSNDLFFEDVRPSYLIQNEKSFKVNAGFPLSVNRFIRFGYAFGESTDNYYQVAEFKKSDTADVTNLNLNVFLIGSERNTTNYKQYPTRGMRYYIRGAYIKGKEHYLPGSTALSDEIQHKKHDWVEISMMYENYFFRNHRIALAGHIEGVYSNKGFLSNHTSSLLDAYAFQPTTHSKTLYIGNYRANSYLALGLKPIWIISDVFHWRNEIYIFSPVKPFEINPIDNSAYYGEKWSQRRFLFSSSIVAHTFFGPVSLGLNYYEKEGRKFYFVFNLGYIFFNPKLRE